MCNVTEFHAVHSVLYSQWVTATATHITSCFLCSSLSVYNMQMLNSWLYLAVGCCHSDVCEMLLCLLDSELWMLLKWQLKMTFHWWQLWQVSEFFASFLTLHNEAVTFRVMKKRLSVNMSRCWWLSRNCQLSVIFTVHIQGLCPHFWQWGFCMSTYNILCATTANKILKNCH